MATNHLILSAQMATQYLVCLDPRLRRVACSVNHDRKVIRVKADLLLATLRMILALVSTEVIRSRRRSLPLEGVSAIRLEDAIRLDTNLGEPPQLKVLTCGDDEDEIERDRADLIDHAGDTPLASGKV
jgi:hypothetical protein